MPAPEKFAVWLNRRQFRCPKFGLLWQYHPRSDEHSKILALYIWEDLLECCPAIRQDYDDSRIRAEVNYRHRWAGTNKEKTIDLAIRRVNDHQGRSDVLISCELKACMTEHGKSKPRIYDELNSSHAIVHSANPSAIAAGVTVINIAELFVSPTRQQISGPLEVTQHRQPHVAEAMVAHLRGLNQRTHIGEEGFDAYSSFLVNCSNDINRPVTLWTDKPAPQPGDTDHYSTFLARICQAYTQRFFSR